MSDLTKLDDPAARPEPPEFTLDPMQELSGRGLALIHRWYLRDLSLVEGLMGAIRQGLAQPHELAPAVRAMPMSQNLELFGTACGKQCIAITNHHELEDRLLYPELEIQGNAPLNAVLARLREEHQLLHHMILALAQSADELAENPSEDGFAACARDFATLTAGVRSHFRYEENAIGAALGYYDIRV